MIRTRCGRCAQLLTRAAGGYRIDLRDHACSNALIAGSDRALLRTRPRLGGKVGVLTRFDLPIVAADSGDRAQVGLGDVYAQAVVVPWLTPRFAVAVGSGLGAPTATASGLGAGKWQAAPLVGPIWFLPNRGGFVLVRLQGHFSFAGDADRSPHQHARGCAHAAVECRTRLVGARRHQRHDRLGPGRALSRRTDVEIGRVVGRAWGVSIKPEIPSIARIDSLRQD